MQDFKKRAGGLGIFRFLAKKLSRNVLETISFFGKIDVPYKIRVLYDIKNYDPRDRDDHFCPECQIGRDILKANPDLAELASRWQFEGDEYQVRFDLLAKYLVEKGSSFDDHFTGQADSCGICHIDYKYIIKLETLHEG